MGVQEMMNLVVEKLKEELPAVENFGGEALPAVENFGGEALLAMENFGGEALPAVENFGGEALLAVENFGGEALTWFNKVLPPETRGDKINHWFHVALPFLIAAVVLTVVFCFCRCCCKCCCMCCCGCGRMVRTMRAPGRNCRMPRGVFESDPKGYFINLRAHPGDQIC